MAKEVGRIWEAMRRGTVIRIYHIIIFSIIIIINQFAIW